LPKAQNWTAGTLKAILVSLVEPVAYPFAVSVKDWGCVIAT